MRHDLPEDFAEFWRGLTTNALSAPLDFHRELTGQVTDTGHLVQVLTFRGMAGEARHGWIAYPDGARRLPGFLWVPPYGRESRLPDAYGTRAGFASLSFNFFGHPAFHQEKYVPARGYFAEGVALPETWILGQMYQDAVIASRVFQAQAEVDEDKIAAMGMSQGGGISIWLGAWNPIIKSVCADMPFLSQIRQSLSTHVYRYPMKELGDAMEALPMGQERIFHTLSYFDTSHVASVSQVPTQVSMGLRDPACRPATVQAVFDALPVKKRLSVYDWGHDWHADMIGNNAEWLRETLG